MEEEILRIFNEVNRDAALEMSYKPGHLTLSDVKSYQLSR